jgi:hypothetical protein
VTAEVEAVMVALAQPEGDASCARTSEPPKAQAELGTLGLCVARVQSWSSCGVQRKP